jgi:hypothetical protein
MRPTAIDVRMRQRSSLPPSPEKLLDLLEFPVRDLLSAEEAAAGSDRPEDLPPDPSVLPPGRLGRSRRVAAGPAALPARASFRRWSFWRAEHGRVGGLRLLGPPLPELTRGRLPPLPEHLEDAELERAEVIEVHVRHLLRA